MSFYAVLAMSLGLTMAADAAAPGAVPLLPLDDGPATTLADLPAAPLVALFWRSDCAPCLIELSHFRALEAAAGKGRLVTVALEPADSARAKLAELNVPDHPAYTVPGAAEAVLDAVSDGTRRLPLSIALDRHGHICARHTGLLGTDLAGAWMAQCSK